MPLSWNEIKDRALGCAVDAFYGKRTFTTAARARRKILSGDADRVAFLFGRYLELAKAPLEAAAEKPKRNRGCG